MSAGPKAGFEAKDAERKAKKAKKRAEDLRRLMGQVTVEEWIKDVKETRQEM